MQERENVYWSKRLVCEVWTHSFNTKYNESLMWTMQPWFFDRGPVSINSTYRHTVRSINSASEHPLGRYDFAGVNRRLGAFTARPGGFSATNFLETVGPTWRYEKKKKKSTRLSHAHSNSFCYCLYVGAGDTVGRGVVVGVGIAGGSRAKYHVGIWPRSSNPGGLDMIR